MILNVVTKILLLDKNVEEIIEEIEFFSRNDYLDNNNVCFRTEQNPHLQDQKTINVNVDFRS